MKIAIPVHEDHIAAVADFADTLVLFEIRNGTEIRRECMPFSARVIPAKVGILSDNGVNILICGAVSRPFASMVVHSGIELVPFISGITDDVIKAYLKGSLADPRFFMPGYRKGMGWCKGRRCCRHGGIRQLDMAEKGMFTNDDRGKNGNA